MNIRTIPLSLVSLSCYLLQGTTSESLWTETYVKATNGFWGHTESVSGPGSTAEQTKIIRAKLEKILRDYTITSMLDVPCGDFNWMRLVDLGECLYIGCDIVRPLIENNIKECGDPNHIFLHRDTTKDRLPKTDLIFCRDLLVHFSLNDIKQTLQNFKKSGAKYLLTTTFLFNRPDTNSDISSGGWRTINLQKSPFNFPAPIAIINENCTEQGGAYSDKSLGLWYLDDITIPE